MIRVIMKNNRTVYRFCNYIIFIFVLFFICSCSENKRVNMNDFSYSNGRGKTYGPNAYGKLVGLDQFEGKFIWVDYASPWCSSCPKQASIMKNLELSFGSKVIFLTVISGDSEPNIPATQETARKWAERFKLDPAKVVAEGPSYRTVPQHALFSPLGQTLYRKEAYHNVDQIKSVISEKVQEWKNWQEKHGE